MQIAATLYYTILGIDEKQYAKERSEQENFKL